MLIDNKLQLYFLMKLYIAPHVLSRPKVDMGPLIHICHIEMNEMSFVNIKTKKKISIPMFYIYMRIFPLTIIE